jgi:signal transduction histidine kinase
MELSYSHIQTVIILINLTVGYVVWTYNSKSNLNRILTFIIICILLIEISALFHLKIEGERFLLTTVILGSLGISFFPPLFYILSLYYPIKKGFNRNQLIAIFGITLFLSLSIIFSFPKYYIIHKLVFPATIKNISLRDLPLAFVFLYFLLTSYSVVLLFFATKNFVQSSEQNIIPYEKRTLRLLTLIGIPLAYLLSIVSVINYFFNIPFPWIGFLLVSFTSFIVILIFRFHIVDLKRLLGGVLFYPALIGILVFIYISLILKNQNKLASTLALPESVTLVLEVFIIYLVVSTLRRALDSSFIRRRFPNVSPSGSMSIEPLEYLSYALTIKGLYKRLQKVLYNYSKVENCYLLMLNSERKAFESVDKRSSFEIMESSELMKVVAKLNRGVTLEELLLYMNNRADITLLDNNGVNLILPINRGSDIIALILLPKRGIFQRWSYEDIISLNYLKATMPSLIERCQMYETEREIEKHQYRMEQLIVIGEMASGLAHEIRNPLSIISTSVETILKNEIKEGDKTKMLQFIQEETNRINILANKLLSINFQKKPELETFNIAATLGRLKSFLEYQLKDRNIQYRIEKDEPIYIYSDPNIIFQILLNLSLNAIEAINRNGIIDVDYAIADTTVSVFIKDDGMGISSKLRDKIFEPFFTTKKKGTGLGLTVTKKLIENLFGYIELLPSKKGAYFKVTLPLLTIDEMKR